MTKGELKELISLAVKEAAEIDEKTHRLHHDFIEAFMEREKRKKEMYDTIKTQVGGWTIILALGFIGRAVWQFVEKQLK